MSETHETPAARSQSRGRSIGMWMALVLAGLLLLLSLYAVWVSRVVLDEDVFVDTSADLIADDAIRDAVATRAVNELFDNVDIRSEIEGQLPEDFKGLSGPATAGLRQASYRLIDEALQQQAFQSLWTLAMTQTHRAWIATVNDDLPAVSTQGGVVTLELEAIILAAADRIGVRDQVEAQLPDDVGSIVLLESEELDAAQAAFRILDTLAWLLPLLTLAAFAFAIWLARDRRKGVFELGIVVFVTALVGIVATRLAGNYVVETLATTSETRLASLNAWLVLTELLRVSFRWFVVLGLVFMLAAWLAGPRSQARSARGFLAPALRGRVWAYVVLAIVVVILLLSGQVNDSTRLLFIAVVAALGAAGIELLRRQTLEEFPDAQASTLLADARARLTGWWEAQQASSMRVKPAAPQAATDVTTRLASLFDLHSQGALTDDEYAAAKARVLAGE